jgi:hypothetical protein
MAIGYNPKTVTDGLVLCLDAANPKSYPGSGTAWRDVSGTMNNGTLIDGPTYNSSNLGSIVFDGGYAYADCGNATSLHSATAVTLEVWFNPTSSVSTGYMIQKNQSSGYELFIDNGDIYAVSSDTFINSSGAPCTNNNWWHCVATFGPSFIPINPTGIPTGFRCYINGTQVASESLATYSPNDITTGNLQIGCFNPGEQVFNGKISIARVYNRVLTVAEVLRNYNATRGRYGI